LSERFLSTSERYNAFSLVVSSYDCTYYISLALGRHSEGRLRQDNVLVLVRLVHSCGFLADFLGVESKEFVTATADSINGGGTFADFLRLLVCMRLLYLNIVNFPICAQLLLKLF